MLSRVYQQIINRACHTDRGVFLAISGAFLLSGCVQGSGLSLKSPSVASDSIVEQADKTEPTQQQHIDAPTMYKILVAEMMVQKGYDMDAFDVVYGLAVKRRDPSLAERAFQLSMKTFDASKVEAATDLWRELSPESAIAWKASFLISLRKGLVEQAIEQWQSYQVLSEESLDQDLILTAQRVAVSMPAEYGLVFFEGLSKRYADRWSAHYAQALVAEGYGQFSDALVSLERAKVMQADESEARIYQLLAKLYLQVGSPEKGLQSIQGYLVTHPTDWLIQERAARLEVQADLYDAAAKRYAMILESVPEANTSRLSLSLIQIEKKLFEQAKANLLIVSEKEGYAEVASYYLGLIYQELNQRVLALNYFDRVKTDAYYVDAQLHKAEIYFAQKQAEKAIELLNSVEAKTAKDQIKLYRAKGVFYSLLEENELAEEQYRKALEVDENNVDILMAQSLLFYNTGQEALYEASLKRVVELRPDDPDALNALGYLYVDNNKNLKEAEEMLNRAYELAPDSYYILDSLGWLYYRQGDYDLAESFLVKALEKQLDDEVLIHLIRTYWKQGKEPKAKDLWQKNHQKFLKNKKLQGLIKLLELE